MSQILTILDGDGDKAKTTVSEVSRIGFARVKSYPTAEKTTHVDDVLYDYPAIVAVGRTAIPSRSSFVKASIP